MIKATIQKDENQRSIILKMSGHANAGPAGEDVVCAGASTLLYTLAQMSMFFYHLKKLRKKPTIKFGEKETLVVVSPKKDFSGEIESAFFFMQTGLALLADNYPRCFDVTVFGKHYGSKPE